MKPAAAMPVARRAGWRLHLGFCLVVSLVGLVGERARAAVVASEQPGRDGLAISARELVELREIAAFSVSPDGHFIAYQSREPLVSQNTYHLTWFVASTTGRVPPVQIAAGGEQDFLVSPRGHRIGELGRPSLAWSQDSKEILFTRRDRGEVHLWRAPRDGSGAMQLTRNAADVMELTWSADGTKVFFTVGRDRADMQRIDEEEGARGFLVREPLWRPYSSHAFVHSTIPAAPPWPLCGDFRFSLPSDAGRACRQTLWVKDLESGIERRATQAEQEAYRASLQVDSGAKQGINLTFGDLPAKPATDGRRVAWLDNEDPEVYQGFLPVRRVAVAARNGARKVRCPAEACRRQFMHLLGWSPDGKEVIFSATDGPGTHSQPGGSLNSFYAWTPGQKTVRVILRTDDHLDPLMPGSSDSCDLRGRRIICLRNGWTQPDQIVAIDIDDGDIDVLIDPNPGFQRFATTRIEKLVWDDGQGFETFGHLIYPSDAEAGKRYPLVITQYQSLGFLWDNHTREAPAGLYAQQGLMVLSVNKPLDWLSVAKPADPVASNAAAWEDFAVRRRGLTALERVLDDLDARGLIDPRRVGISGLSTGASITDQGLVYTRRFAAASTAYSNTAPMSYYLLPDYLRDSLRAIYGGKPFDAAALEVWRRHAVGLNAGCINVPHLIHVADRELYDTLQNYVDLQEVGKPVELYVFPDEYHVKWQPVHRYNIYRRNAQWFGFWLQDQESDDPVDADQYARWRELRAAHLKNLAAPPPAECQQLDSAVHQ